MAKVKTGERVGWNNYVGVTLMSLMQCIGEGLMTSWFMVYLTDYAGLGTFGAAVGSILLVVMRLFDAVNDPLEGWIMDRAKVGKYGKYKPFIILSILLQMTGISALFFIPHGIAGTPVLVVIWVVVGYLLYDVGYSFFAPNLVYRTMTMDSTQRGKLMKEAGYNAIRSAHNPCSRAMLEACDELGVYMMDEGWDMWFHHKSKFDYASKWRKNYLSDLKAMVDRDFNNPSVILYSIGNEVSEPAKDDGIENAKETPGYPSSKKPQSCLAEMPQISIQSSMKKAWRATPTAAACWCATTWRGRA